MSHGLERYLDAYRCSAICYQHSPSPLFSLYSVACASSLASPVWLPADHLPQGLPLTSRKAHLVLAQAGDRVRLLGENHWDSGPLPGKGHVSINPLSSLAFPFYPAGTSCRASLVMGCPAPAADIEHEFLRSCLTEFGISGPGPKRLSSDFIET